MKYNPGTLFFLLLLLSACTDRIPDGGKYPDGGTVLNLMAGVSVETRLAELGNINNINENRGTAHKHIGLYIYYKEDYDKDDLTKPYIRNMECKIEDNKLVPVNATSNEEKNIYIYDNMTIVAFYPYNQAMNDPDNYFENIDDEENYPITEANYSDQYYIPYRGILSGVNPTNAYSAKIWLYPKHTVKVEVILISNSFDELPDGTGNVRILPDLDPVTADLTFDCRRAAWVDNMDIFRGGEGTSMGRYTTYLWQRDGVVEKDHVIPENSVLFKSDNLTLLTSEEINFTEKRAYRFGYNLSNGEVFIPTADQIAFDANSLQGANYTESSVYQACDINLEGYDWQPLTLMNGRFDGGGHRITGLKLTKSIHMAGLFAAVKGDSEVRNVNLINPVINIGTLTSDSCYVGSLCARLNAPLTASEIEKLRETLPDELSDVVKNAILEEMKGNLVNSTSRLIACRVEEPEITLESVASPQVGTVVGTSGHIDENGIYYGDIWDCYSLGGKIVVNKGSEDHNLNPKVQVGGFCGYNSGKIRRSYTTIQEDNIIFEYKMEIGPIGNEETVYIKKDCGFSFNNDNTSEVTDCYAIYRRGDNETVPLFSELWPEEANWIRYTDNKWPVYTQHWTYSNNSFWWDLGAKDKYYPKLQWERK